MIKDSRKDLNSVILRIRNIVIGIEIFSIFMVSLIVSTLRFNSDIYAALFEYPGQPKILVYPFMWYFFLQKSHAWDRSIFYFTNDFYSRVINAGFKSLIAFASFAYLAKFPISRLWVIANVLATTFALLIIRFFTRAYLKNKISYSSNFKYLYIGSNLDKDRYLEEFKSLYGFIPEIIRLYPPKNETSEKWIARYEDIVDTEAISGTIVGYGEIQDAALIRRLADTKRDKVIDLILISRIASLLNRFDLQDNPNVVRIREFQIVGSGAVLKRFLDIVLSSSALIILSPIFILTAIAVKITSPGPILYVDKRIGINGILFDFPKFRSMYIDSDKERLATLGRPDEKMLERYKSDPRITPFGRFIRRWSIDELPQFWCVLIGTMSIVGPRPILKEELSQVENRQLLRFVAKPGLTGLWQVTGRKEVGWNDRMLRDTSYVDEWSLSKDFILIVQTFWAIIKGTGAH